jgi:O-antigen/teichoic acid export membrane protein
LSVVTRFLKGSVLLSVASVIMRLSGILVLIPLARLLGAQQLGIYSLVIWIVQSAMAIGLLGVDAAMHRNGAKMYQTDPVKTGSLLGTGSLLMLMSYASLAIALWVWRLPLAEHWIANAAAARWFGFAVIYLIFEALSTIGSTLLLSLHRFREHSLTTTIGSLGRLLLSPLLALHYGLIGALVGVTLASFLQSTTALIGFWHSKKQYKIKLSYQGFWQQSQEIFKFGLPFWGGNALIALFTLPIMGEIGRVAGVETLGQLRIAQSLCQIVGFLPGAIAPVAISLLSETHTSTSNDQDFRRLRSLHLRGNWLIALTLVVFLSVASYPIIHLLFGDAYRKSIPLVIGMGWVSLMVVIVENLNLYTLSAGNTKLIAIGSIIQKAIFLGLSFYLIPRFAGTGFIIGSLVAGTFQLLVMLLGVWRKFEFDLQLQFSMLLFWSSALFGIIYLGRALYLPVFLGLSLAVIFSFINVVLIIIFVLNKSEKTYLKQTLHKYIKF